MFSDSKNNNFMFSGIRVIALMVAKTPFIVQIKINESLLVSVD